MHKKKQLRPEGAELLCATSSFNFASRMACASRQRIVKTSQEWLGCTCPKKSAK